MPFRRFSRSRRQPKWIDKQILDDSRKRPAYPAKIVKVSNYKHRALNFYQYAVRALNVWEERYISIYTPSIYKYTMNMNLLAFINCIRDLIVYSRVFYIFLVLLQHISGPLADGSLVREISDFEVYIKAVFTPESLKEIRRWAGCSLFMYSSFIIFVNGLFARDSLKNYRHLCITHNAHYWYSVFK